MSTIDYITRSEHDKDIQRLTEADALLQQGIAEVERVLRADYETKIATAIVAVNTTLNSTKIDLKEDLQTVDNHLTSQDEKYEEMFTYQNRMVLKVIGAIGLTALGAFLSFLGLLLSHVVKLG